MGVVNFDPDVWLAEHAQAPDPAKVAKVAKVDPAPAEPTLAGLATLAARLPDEVENGLVRLVDMRPPRGVDLSEWSAIVADAQRLADDGYAAAALSLGWSVMQLYGVSDRREGLALWWAGRPRLLIAADWAMVRLEDGSRALMDRRPMPGGKLLWELK